MQATAWPQAIAEEANEQTGPTVLEFVRPIIGFTGSTHYEVRGLGENYEPFAVLASLDEPGLEFIVVPPGALFSDYVIELPDADVSLLHVTEPDSVVVLVLVTRRPGSTPTVNLMGPIVVNSRTRQAIQVVLQDEAFGLAVPVDGGSARSRA